MRRRVGCGVVRGRSIILVSILLLHQESKKCERGGTYVHIVELVLIIAPHRVVQVIP